MDRNFVHNIQKYVPYFLYDLFNYSFIYSWFIVDFGICFNAMKTHCNIYIYMYIVGPESLFQPLIILLLTPHIFTVVRMTAHIHLLQKNKGKTYMVYLKIIARFQMKFTPWQKKQSQKFDKILRNVKILNRRLLSSGGGN